MTYRWRHGRWPDFAVPTRFTELVQCRKLDDRDRRLIAFSDKLSVKGLVLDRLGEAWVTPTLWCGTALPDRAEWPLPFVVKSRHGVRQIAFVRADDEDWAAIRAASARWMRGRYGWWLDEWAYGQIPRGLLVEPFVGIAGQLPVDYKFYVFGGRVGYVQVHLAREHAHRWLLFDRCWKRVSRLTADPDPPRLVSLARMIAAAETLSSGFDFVRVDLYDLPDGPRFGEMTFYPGSGLDPFDPPALDHRLGAAWLAALSRRTAGPASPDIS